MIGELLSQGFCPGVLFYGAVILLVCLGYILASRLKARGE